mgnify:CR=1 FL=1|jgi:hypothetical protein|tara:strand:- start:624 stop:953 length:330 start_codon:yes stop_codon:yes gene_type:complete
MSESEGQLQDYSVDQLGGFVVMVAGAIGSLLLVVWQSKCHCKVNCCYLFQCERRPPSEEEMKGLKDQAQKLKDKKDKKDKDKDLEKGTVDRSSHEKEPAPEPEPLIPSP